MTRKYLVRRPEARPVGYKVSHQACANEVGNNTCLTDETLKAPDPRILKGPTKVVFV